MRTQRKVKKLNGYAQIIWIFLFVYIFLKSRKCRDDHNGTDRQYQTRIQYMEVSERIRFENPEKNVWQNGFYNVIVKEQYKDFPVDNPVNIMMKAPISDVLLFILAAFIRMHVSSPSNPIRIISTPYSNTVVRIPISFRSRQVWGAGNPARILSWKFKTMAGATGAGKRLYVQSRRGRSG